VSGQSGSGSNECTPLMKTIAEYFNDSLEVSFDIIKHMIQDNLAILSKISEERNDKWVSNLKKVLGEADEVCDIAFDIVTYETLSSLINESDIKKHANYLQNAVQDLWYVHENLKELQKEDNEELAEKVVEAAAGALDNLENILFTIIGSINMSVLELKKYCMRR